MSLDSFPIKIDAGHARFTGQDNRITKGSKAEWAITSDEAGKSNIKWRFAVDNANGAASEL